MILKFVTHDLENNTLEVVWLEAVYENGELISYERVRCESYSQGQREQFISDTGKPEYADLADW